MIRRWKRLCTVALVLGLLAVLFAPSILTGTGQVPAWLAKQGFGDVLQVRCDRVSMHWWSPVVVSGLSLKGADGETLAEISQLQSEASLFGLLWSPTRRRRWRAENAELQWVSRRGGSNWEDLLNTFSSSSATPAAETEPPTFSLMLVNAEIVLREAGSTQGTTVQTEVVHVARERDAWQLSVQGKVASGRLQLEARGSVAAGTDPPDMQVSLALQQWPLTPWQPLLTRLAAPLQLFGGACTGQATFRQQSSRVSTSGAFQLHAPAGMLAGVRPVRWILPSAAAHWRAEQSAGHWHATADIAQEDWGRADFEAHVPAPTTNSLASWARSLSQGTLSSRGTLDLRALARAWPSAKAHGAGDALAGYDASWDVHIKQTQEVALCQADLSVEPSKRGTQDGLQLLEPLRGRVQLRWQEPFDFHIDELSLAAAGLELQGTGDARGGQLAMDADLGRLLQQVWPGTENQERPVAGRFQANVDWRQLSSDIVHVTGNVGWRDLVIETAGGTWHEPQGNLRAVSRWTGVPETLAALQQGQVTLELAEEWMEARLGKRPASPSDRIPLSIELRAVDVGKWLRRAGQWYDVAGLELDGRVHARGDLAWDPTSLRVTTLEGEVRELQGKIGQRQWRDPMLSFALRDLEWQRHRAVHAAQLTLVSSTLSGVFQDLRYDPVAASLEGRGGVRADLERLAGLGSPLAPTGELIMQFWWQGSPEAITYGVDARAAAFQGTFGNIRWSEQPLKVSSRGAWDVVGQTVDLTHVSVEGERLSSNFAGQVTLEPAHFDLVGEVNGDWTWWCTQAGVRDVRIESSGPHRFRLRGPVDAHGRLVAEGDAGWRRAQVGGVPLGPTAFRITLEDGVVGATPIRAAIGDGYVEIIPRLVGADPVRRVELSPGKIAHRVPITPDITQRWLKYAAPLLSDLTRSEARFSVELTQGQFPLQHPLAAELAGDLILHEGSVGPGYNMTQLMELANQIKRWTKQGRGGVIADTQRAWVTLPTQRVPLRVHGGRVYHRDLTMLVDGMRVRSSGSVDLQSDAIDLVLTLPLSGSRLADLGLAGGTANREVQIPVQGTVSSPRLDERAWAGLLRSATEQAAQGYLHQQLQRHLPGSLRDALDEQGGVEQAVERALGKGLRRLFD